MSLRIRCVIMLSTCLLGTDGDHDMAMEVDEEQADSHEEQSNGHAVVYRSASNLSATSDISMELSKPIVIIRIIL